MKYLGEEVSIETIRRQEEHFNEIKSSYSSKISGVFQDAIQGITFTKDPEKLKNADGITEDLIAMDYFLDKVLKDEGLDKTVKTPAQYLKDRIYPLMRQAYTMRDIYVGKAFENDYIAYRAALKEATENKDIDTDREEEAEEDMEQE